MKKYDVVVIGGGPSGMAAALSAAEHGASTVILETDIMLGGILNQCIHNGFGLHVFGEELTGPEYAQRFQAQVDASTVDVLLNTIVLSVSPQRVVTALSKEKGLLEIEAGSVVFSTGCRERSRGSICIPGTRPAGVLTAGTAQKYVNIKGYMVGKECVILGSGDIGLIMARRMTFEGAKVKAVVEIMPHSSGLTRNIVQCLDDFGIPLHLSHTIIEVHGEKRVTGVTIVAVDETLAPVAGTERSISCDTLLLSVGLIPCVELAQEAGAQMEGSHIMVDQNFETTAPGIFICGNALHVHDLVDYVTEESRIAGIAAARHALKQDTHPANAGSIKISSGAGISYVVPHQINCAADADITLRFRPTKVFRNTRLEIISDGHSIAQAKRPIMTPGEMESFKLKAGALKEVDTELTVRVQEA